MFVLLDYLVGGLKSEKQNFCLAIKLKNHTKEFWKRRHSLLISRIKNWCLPNRKNKISYFIQKNTKQDLVTL